MKKHRCILDGTDGEPWDPAFVAVCLETGAESDPPAYEINRFTPFEARAVERLDAACAGAKHEVEQ